MKSSIKLLTVLFLILGTSSLSYAQSCNGVTLNRNISLKGTSDVQEVKIKVEKNAKNLNIAVNSALYTGSLTIEIYDPKGKKQGNYSVESLIIASDNIDESVCGQIQKAIKDPMKGDWKVKLIANNAKGEVSICTKMSQYEG